MRSLPCPRQFIKRVIFTSWGGYFLLLTLLAFGWKVQKWLRCDSFEGQKLEVLDGDTLFDPKDHLRMRIELIDAPELAQPFGGQSKRALEKFVQGELMICYNGEDVYGRKLIELWKGQQNYVEVALTQGDAVVFSAFIHPKKSFYRKLKFWESKAKQNRQGVWSQDSFVYPHLWRAKEKKLKKRVLFQR